MAEDRRASAPVAVIAHPGAELYGSDRVMLETVAALAGEGWRVVVVLPEAGPLVAAVETTGGRVEILRTPVLRKCLLRPERLAGTAISAASGLRAIRRLLRAVQPDLVYVSTLTLPLWVVAARRERLPVLVHVHESERQAARPLRLALALPLRLADRVVFNSAFSRSSVLELLPSLAARSTVVYNGVPGPEQATAPRPELSGGLHVVYVGRISPRKGVDVAVDAVGRLVAEGIDARLDVVGGVFPGYEWYETRLHERAAELGIADRVRFRGFQDSVWSALEASDVAVVPSRLAEPFGNTAVEAVLAGRPVVVSAIGGLAEAIDGFASAVPVVPDDPAALAAALRRISSGWRAFTRSSIALAPLARSRYAPAAYRDRIGIELSSLLPRDSLSDVPA